MAPSELACIFGRPQWIYHWIQAMYRFWPLTPEALTAAVNAAWEEEIRQELKDPEWPCPWWEEQERERESNMLDE